MSLEDVSGMHDSMLMRAHDGRQRGVRRIIARLEGETKIKAGHERHSLAPARFEG